ncbi:MAG: transcriptional repressor [Prevotellaceae bacterium]|nr:transcriptional repressor [Candidatus Colivivens equi]
MDFYQQAYDILTKYIAEKKLRKTPERYHMLEAVYRHDGHFTAEELLAEMQTKFRVSRATVYNNLDLFVKAGLVVKNLLADTIIYEKCLGMTAHHHMVCTMCGAIKEFSDVNIEKAVNGARYQKFRKQTYCVNVYGICNKCMVKMSRARKRLNQ